MFVNEWDAEISENDIFNLDSNFEISVVNDKKTADTCNLIEIEKSEKEKNICSNSDFSWNNELLKLCCNFTVDFDSTDLKDFVTIFSHITNYHTYIKSWIFHNLNISA